MWVKIKKVIDKLTKKYKSFKTEYNEIIIYTNAANEEELKQLFK